ncbi:MAG: S-layer homology domain-containing protein, partial [Clostridia bacterium]|nr:S-layer homology domain-containing protein [Clostridia bacterium]
MRRKAIISKIITSALVLCVIFALAAAAAELSDISGHWAEEYISYGVEKGYINGYADGTFKPDVNVTRAEFSKMINSSLGITKEAENPFFDVEETDWFYSDVKKAVYAGYISGYENGAFIATNYITRQEAAAILSRIATRPENTKSLSSVSDEGDIADWARDYMVFVFSKGFMTGDENKNLNPKGNLTRGQAAKLIYMLATEENVYNGDYKVSLDNALLFPILLAGGGLLSVTAAYDESADAPRFVNRMKDGSLSIHKLIRNETTESADAEFPFCFTLTDPNGN